MDGPLEPALSKIKLPVSTAVFRRAAEVRAQNEKARAAPEGHGRAPLRRPCDQAADLTSIFLACAGAGFGMVTFSTPLAMFALIASALTPSGNSSVRWNEP